MVIRLLVGRPFYTTICEKPWLSYFGLNSNCYPTFGCSTMAILLLDVLPWLSYFWLNSDGYPTFGGAVIDILLFVETIAILLLWVAMAVLLLGPHFYPIFRGIHGYLTFCGWPWLSHFLLRTFYPSNLWSTGVA